MGMEHWRSWELSTVMHTSIRSHLLNLEGDHFVFCRWRLATVSFPYPLYPDKITNKQACAIIVHHPDGNHQLALGV